MRTTRVSCACDASSAAWRSCPPTDVSILLSSARALAAEGLHETEVGWVSEPVLRWSVMAIQLHCDD